MKLRTYHFKRTVEDTNSSHGVVVTSVEKCPINSDIIIGSSECINKSCCESHSPFINIVMKTNSWIKCEATRDGNWNIFSSTKCFPMQENQKVILVKKNCKIKIMMDEINN
jgi:hypothetical protein